MTRFSDFTDEELVAIEEAFCNEGLKYLVGEIRKEREDRKAEQLQVGDEVYVHGYIDEIRNMAIIRNAGGCFETPLDEIKKISENCLNKDQIDNLMSDLQKGEEFDRESTQERINPIIDPILNEQRNTEKKKVGIMTTEEIARLVAGVKEEK